MRHDRRAEDAGGEQHAVGALEARDEPFAPSAAVEADAQRVVEEAQQDDAEHPDDDELEAAVPPALEPEHREGDDGGDDPRLEQRDAEQQVQRDRRADELGQVGRHGDQLGLDPQPPGDRPREVDATQLGQVVAGRDARSSPRGSG